MDPTPLSAVDAAIERLHEKKDAWLAVPIPARIALLEKCIAGVLANAERWGAIGARIKGLAPDDVRAGEEWVAGIMPTVRNARLLADALRANGAPKPRSVRTRGDRTIARVYPRDGKEFLLFLGAVLESLSIEGVTADVWMQPGKPASQGAIYRDATKGEGKVCLVLGGGNVSSIPPMDVLYKLFVENEVVLLKMNPVNEELGPVFADAFSSLIDEGVLAIAYGGAQVGAHAAEHPKIGSLHVTGSDRTYDAIVWGGHPKTKDRPRKNDRPFTAELGCVTPVIVVPGPWSASDIRYQARHVASMVTQNASFNCNAAKVIVTARGWLQREAFLAALHEELRSIAPRRAYYPGARQRYEAFLAAYPNALVLGATEPDSVPWTAIPDVPDTAGGYALGHEAFCGIVAEVTLDLADDAGGFRHERDRSGPNLERFLERAVAFANERCWGTLSCCLLAHHDTLDEHADAIARAVADLRYGAIGVNVWPGVVYALVSPTWGAFPGHTPEDIQSGVGVVHNAYLFDHPEKTVVKGPFRLGVTPPWFADHKNLLDLGKKLVAFEADPTWSKFFQVARAAMRG